jgi:hypothetical protein
MDEGSEWGGARLTQLFNFRARQVTTVYERGGVESYRIPRGEYSNYENGKSVAVTASLQVQNFRDIEGEAEIEAMHAKLTELGGKPPAINSLVKSKPGLSQ